MSKIKTIVFLTFFLLVLPACNTPVASPTVVVTQPTQLPPAQQQPIEIPPTLVPDTPAPAAINAPLVQSPVLEDIHFLNEKDGWGVTETQILRTNDGGVTWYNVTPSDVSAAGYNAHTFVLDNERVWVQITDFSVSTSTSMMYRTADGGITWAKFTVPYGGGRINFLDEKNGWAFGDLGAGAGSDAVAVYQTTDGGATWTQTYTNDPNQPNAGDSLPLGGIKSGLTPLNMKTAWVSGVVYSDGTVYVYRTDDGGVHWSQVTTLALPAIARTTQISFDPIQFVTAQDAFVAVHIPTDQNQLAIYASHDAGNTWSLTPTLIPNGNATNFLSTTDAVIFNGDQFYVTKDAAQTWNTVPADPKFHDTFAMMDFVNTSTGWVITSDANSHNSLYRTSDGGATWSNIIP